MLVSPVDRISKVQAPVKTSGGKIAMVALCALGLLALAIIGYALEERPEKKPLEPELVKSLQQGLTSSITCLKHMTPKVLEKDKDGLNVMHHAIRLNNKKVVDHLLLIGYEFDDQMKKEVKNNPKWSLAFSSAQDLSNYVAWLVEDGNITPGLDMSSVRAIGSEREPLPDPDCTKDGLTLFQKSVMNLDRGWCIEFMQRSKRLDVVDSRGYTLLHLLFEQMSHKTFCDCGAIFKEWMRGGHFKGVVNVKTTDGQPKNALDYFICRAKETNCLKDNQYDFFVGGLLEKGAVPTVKTTDMERLVKISSQRRDLGALDHLTQSNLYAPNADSKDLAFLMAAFSDYETLEWGQKALFLKVERRMLECGAGAYTRTGIGSQTPLQMAANIGAGPLAIMLESGKVEKNGSEVGEVIERLVESADLTDDQKVERLSILKENNLFWIHFFPRASVDLASSALDKIGLLSSERLESSGASERAKWKGVMLLMWVRSWGNDCVFWKCVTAQILTELIEQSPLSPIDVYTLGVVLEKEDEAGRQKFIQWVVDKCPQTSEVKKGAALLVSQFGSTDQIVAFLERNLSDSFNMFQFRDGLASRPSGVDDLSKHRIIQAVLPFARFRKYLNGVVGLVHQFEETSSDEAIKLQLLDESTAKVVLEHVVSGEITQQIVDKIVEKGCIEEALTVILETENLKNFRAVLNQLPEDALSKTAILDTYIGKYEDLKDIGIMLDLGAPLEVIYLNGPVRIPLTPLQSAVNSARLQVVRLLLNRGADMYGCGTHSNGSEVSNNSPFYMSCEALAFGKEWAESKRQIPIICEFLRRGVKRDEGLEVLKENSFIYHVFGPLLTQTERLKQGIRDAMGRLLDTDEKIQEFKAAHSENTHSKKILKGQSESIREELNKVLQELETPQNEG